jgi:hypothetical protein
MEIEASTARYFGDVLSRYPRGKLKLFLEVIK